MGTIEDKILGLNQAKSDKLNNLTNKYNTVGNSPELMNTLTPEELQYNLGYALGEQVYTRPDGSQFQYALNPDGTFAADEQGNWIEQPFSTTGYANNQRNLYIDNTKEGNYKLGLAASDTKEGISPFEARYRNNLVEGNPYVNPRPTLYDGTPGPLGVTPEDGALLDVTLPYNTASGLERLIHSNRGQLLNRTIGDGKFSKDDAKLYGTGVTEYTTPNAPLWNVDASIEGELDPETLLPKQPYQNKPVIDLTQAVAPEKDYVSNLVDAGQAGVGTFAAKTADTAIDGGIRAAKTIFGNEAVNEQLKDYSAFDEKGDFVGLDKFKLQTEYGYDPEKVQDADASIRKAYQDPTIGNVFDALVDSVQAGPEVLLTSAGDMAAAFAGPAGWAVYVSNFNNEILEERASTVGGADNLDAKDRTIALAGAVPAALINTLSRGNVGLVDMKAGMQKAIKEGGTAIAKYGVKKGLASSIGEGLEEGVQEALVTVASKIDTANEDELLSDKFWEDLAVSSGLGFGAGAAGSTAGVVKDLTGEATGEAKARFDRLKAERERRKKEAEQSTETPDQAVSDVDEGIKKLFEADASGDNVGIASSIARLQDLAAKNPDNVKVHESIGEAIRSLSKSKEKARKTLVDGEVATLGAEMKDVKSDDKKAMVGFMMDVLETSDLEKAETSVRTLADRLGLDAGELEIMRKDTIKAKSIDQVSEEAESGVKGYSTFYSQYRDALASGDSTKAEQAKLRLEAFRTKHANKLATFDDAIEDIERDVQDLAQNMVDTGTAVDVANALSIIADGEINWEKGTSTYGTPKQVGTFTMYPENVAQKLLGISPSPRSLYRVRDKIADEVTKMRELEGGLVSEPSTAEAEPTPKEVAEKIAKGEQITDADRQTQDNEGKAIEDELKKLKEKADQETRVIARLVEKGDLDGAARKVNKSTVLSKRTKEAMLKRIDAKRPQEAEIETKSEPTSDEKPKKDKVVVEEKKAPEAAEKGVKQDEVVKETTAFEGVPDDVEQLEFEIKVNKDFISKKEKELKDEPSTEKIEELTKEIAKAEREIREAEKAIGIGKVNQMLDNSYTPLASELLASKKSPKIAKFEPFKRDRSKAGKFDKTITTYNVFRFLNTIKEDLKGDHRDELDLKESPFRLLIGKDGRFGEEVSAAMAGAINDYLASRLSDLNSNDDVQIAKMFGKNNASDIPYTIREKYRKKGRFEAQEAQGLGAAVVRNLGIEAVNSADYDFKERLEVDGGELALAVMDRMGLIQRSTEANALKAVDFEKDKAVVEGREPSKEKTKAVIHTIKAGKGWLQVSKDAQALSEELDLGSDYIKAPRFSKNSGKKKYTTRNAAEWTELTQEQQKAMNHAANTAHEVRADRVEVLEKLWGEPVEQTEIEFKENGKKRTKKTYILDDNKLKVAKLFGWKDPSMVHIDKRDGVEGKNREVVRSIQAISEFKNEAKGKDVYFDYFFSKNGRFFIDSTNINPQTDKLHRFLVDAKVNKKTQLVTPDSLAPFQIGVVQAFDGSKLVANSTKEKEIEIDGEIIRDLGAIDKQSQEANIRAFEALVNTDVIRKVMKDPSPENILEAIEGTDHPSHAIAAILELTKYNDIEAFSTTLTMETDAVTSGFGIMNAVAPVLSGEKLSKWLPKVGIWLGENIKSYGEWRGTEGNMDSYETGAQGVNQIVSTQPKTWVHDYIGGVGRGFMKAPFMTFMYGSGDASIKRAMGTEYADKIIDDLSNEDTVVATLQMLDTALDESTKSLQGKEKMKWLIGKNKLAKAWVSKMLKTPNPAGVVRETRINPATPLGRIYDMVSRDVQNTYGAATTEYLSGEFNEIVTTRRAMNSAFIGMFGVFKDEYDKRVAKLLDEAQKSGRGGKLGRFSKVKLSIAEKDGVLADMVQEGLIPGIMTVEAKHKYEKAPILKSERLVDPEITVQTQMKAGDRVVNPMLREMVVNPSAGAVVNIHYTDGAMIMKLITDSVGLGVHDAFVAHVNNVTEAGKQYNEKFWELTQNWDMLGEIGGEFNKFVKMDRKIANEAIKDSLKEVVFDPDALADIEKTDMVQETLDTLNEFAEVARTNKETFKKTGGTVSNMAGPEGVELVIKPQTVKKKSKGKAQLSSDIMSLAKEQTNKGCIK